MANRVSNTALKVGLVLITLNEKPGWRERLPEGLVDLTERLLLAADVLGYGRTAIALSKRPWVVRLSERSERRMPGIFEAIGRRKLFMEQQVRLAIEDGATQVLVLGAGFDTLCLRLAPRYPDVRFFEIDRPATSAAKATGVAEIGQPENMTLVVADLASQSLSTVLPEIDCWASDGQTVVVAEGLLLYLDSDDVRALFLDIADCTGAGSRVAFSYGIAVDRYPTTQTMLRLIGEPWLSSCQPTDLPDYVGDAWSVFDAPPPQPAQALEGFAVVEKQA